MTLPPFEVVVWLKKTADCAALRNELIEHAIEEPDEWTEFERVVDHRDGERGPRSHRHDD